MDKSQSKKARSSNFELLRIICMISIIVIHIFSQTDVEKLKLCDGVRYFFVIFLGFAGRLVCNCFVMIGAWFLCDSKFQSERIVNLWLQVFFYASVITVACRFIGIQDADTVRLVQSFLPVMGRPVWFAAEYICLLMLSPFLNMLLEKSMNICRKLLVIFGVLIIGCATCFPVAHTTPAFSELVWFCFLYLFIAYFKRSPRPFMNKKRVCFYMFMAVYIFCICTYTVLRENKMETIAAYYLAHYENLFSFMASVFLFYTFKNMDIGRKKIINLVSESTFAVYLIHQTPCFYPTLWNGIFSVDNYVGSNYLILYVLFVIIVLFAVSIVADCMRVVMFERFVYTRKLYQKVCRAIDKFFEL